MEIVDHLLLLKIDKQVDTLYFVEEEHKLFFFKNDDEWQKTKRKRPISILIPSVRDQATKLARKICFLSFGWQIKLHSVPAGKEF